MAVTIDWQDLYTALEESTMVGPADRPVLPSSFARINYWENLRSVAAALVDRYAPAAPERWRTKRRPGPPAICTNIRFPPCRNYRTVISKRHSASRRFRRCGILAGWRCSHRSSVGGRCDSLAVLIAYRKAHNARRRIAGRRRIHGRDHSSAVESSGRRRDGGRQRDGGARSCRRIVCAGVRGSGG